MMAAILNCAILNLTILDSAIIVFSLKLTHTCQDWFPPFAQKKLHSFILTQLDDGSHLEFCHLGFSHFAQKASLIHSDSTWWWQQSWILPCWIQTPCYLLSDSLKNTLTSVWPLNQTTSIWLTCQDWFNHLEFCHQKKLPSRIQPFCTKSLMHSLNSDSCWWLQQSWILQSWIQTPCYLLSDSLKNTLTPLWLLNQTNSIWLKLIHSHLTWWWQESWILPFWILPSWIQPSYYFLSNSLTLAKISSHYLHKKNSTHSFWLNLMMAAILNLTILDWAIIAIFLSNSLTSCQN